MRVATIAAVALCCVGIDESVRAIGANSNAENDGGEASARELHASTSPTPGLSGKHVVLTLDEVTNEAIHRISLWPNVESVTLACPKDTIISGNTIAALSSLHGLSSLTLVGVSDSVEAGLLKGVKELRSLKILKIRRTEITPQSCQIISQMLWLEELEISDTHSLNDECLKALKAMPRVKKLGLFTTDVTDASIPILERWPQHEGDRPPENECFCFGD